MGAVALLLLIDLLFLPWVSISVVFLGQTVSDSSTATGAPDGWTGIIALLATIALVGDLAVERFSPQTTLPNWGGGREATRFRLAVVIAAFLLLKLLFHVSDTFDYAAFGFWAAIVLTIVLLVGTRRLSQGETFIKGSGTL